jgi:hypothetical protein
MNSVHLALYFMSCANLAAEIHCEFAAARRARSELTGFRGFSSLASVQEESKRDVAKLSAVSRTAMTKINKKTNLWHRRVHLR